MAPTHTVGRGGGHSPVNVTKHLKGIDFPAGKQQLINQAKQGGADREVLQEIQGMDDRQYTSMADVMKSYGKEHHGASKSPQSKR